MNSVAPVDNRGGGVGPYEKMERGAAAHDGRAPGGSSSGRPPFRWGRSVWHALGRLERGCVVIFSLIAVLCAAFFAQSAAGAYAASGVPSVSSDTLNAWATLLTGAVAVEGVCVILSPHPAPAAAGQRPWRSWWHAAYDIVLGLIGLLTGAAYSTIASTSTTVAAALLPFLWIPISAACVWALLWRTPSADLLSIRMGHWGKDETCCKCCEGSAMCRCCRPVRCSNCFQQFLRSLLCFFALGWTVLAMTLLSDHINFYPPLGEFTQVTAGYPPGKSAHLHYYCSGERAFPTQPTVLLEHGGGSSHASFLPLHRLLETKMRVCSYDRAGYGYSSVGIYPRSDQQGMEEVLEVLEAAGETGPLVCAGHSAGGNKCLYLNKHTDRVKGVALLDAYCNYGSCDIERKWFDATDLDPALFDRMIQTRMGLTDALRWLQVLGYTLGIGSAGFDGAGYSTYNYHQWRVWDSQFLEYRGSVQRDWTEDELSIWTAPSQTQTPIIVVGAGTNETCAERAEVQPELLEDESKCQDYLVRQAVTQEQLAMYAATSTNGRVVHCTDGCYHGFVYEKPQAAADAISELVCNTAPEGC